MYRYGSLMYRYGSLIPFSIVKHRYTLSSYRHISQNNNDPINILNKQLSKGWSVKDSNHLYKTFKFKDFKEALSFTNKVGLVSDEEGHHPDVILSYGEVSIKLHTHDTKGLTQKDFILALKIDDIV
eukprot:GHVR01148714.1.p1 GENE.GHVR01148714.1~~GHVR01148714.1.p1  ORF type:complete len:126 (+),score=17.39 GHVR01148714.1:86-463(+)